jgi:hypothetical protein
LHAVSGAPLNITFGQMATIRITSIPPGEAPVGIREAWVGLELPLKQ